MMKAILTNKVTGERIPVTSTTSHPDSSYGQAIWVDEKGQAYCVVGMPNPLYEVTEITVTGRESLGQLLRMARIEQGISIRDLAERCELSKSTIVNIEKGAFWPRMDIVLKIASTLGKTIAIE